MAQKYDLTGNQVVTSGVNSAQSVANVTIAAPTAAELTATFGSPTVLGRGFIATVDDNNDDTASVIVWTTDASWFWAAGTKSA